MAFNNEIEEVKAQLKVLEKKLALLEELSKTKSPVEEAFKEFYGAYPITDIADTSWDSDGWVYFEAGYNAAQKDYKVGEYQEPEKEPEELMEKLGFVKNSDGNWTAQPLVETAQERGERVHNEMEETIKIHDGYGVVDYKPTPQTPEETEQSLKEAFREAIKQGIIPEVDKVSDEFMDEMVAELKGQTLTDIIWNWWGNVFTSNEDWDAENAIEHLVDLIEAFLPKPQNAAGSQNAYVECTVEGFNDCLNGIKRKLR